MIRRSPDDRDPLLLTAGELFRIRSRETIEPENRQEFESRFLACFPCQPMDMTGREGDVVQHTKNSRRIIMSSS